MDFYGWMVAPNKIVLYTNTRVTSQPRGCVVPYFTNLSFHQVKFSDLGWFSIFFKKLYKNHSVKMRVGSVWSIIPLKI